jgi:hypothetical protein
MFPERSAEGVAGQAKEGFRLLGNNLRHANREPTLTQNDPAEKVFLIGISPLRPSGGFPWCPPPAVFSPQDPAPGDTEGIGDEPIPAILADQIDSMQINLFCQVHLLSLLYFLYQFFHADLHIPLLIRQTSIEVRIDPDINDVSETSGGKVLAAADAECIHRFRVLREGFSSLLLLLLHASSTSRRLYAPAS